MASGAVYSFKKGGKIVAHRRSGLMTNVVFEIYEAPLLKIRSEYNKRPCCYMTGEWEGRLSPTEQSNANNEALGEAVSMVVSDWYQVSFNPHINDTFQYYDHSQQEYRPLITAERVVFLSNFFAPALAVPYLILAQSVNEDLGKATRGGLNLKRRWK